MLPDPPKDRGENLAFRDSLDRTAQTAEGRLAIFERCSDPDPRKGLLFWVNSYVCCFNPKLAQPHLPMITWAVQDKAFIEIYNHIENGEYLFVDKTREMALSWTCMTVFCWYWLFTESANFLVGSRKEELVDGKSMDALLPKIDYILERIGKRAQWMIPEGYAKKSEWRTFKHIINPVTLCSIDGEATNPDFGRGGRKRAIMLDEHGSMKDAEKIQEAIAQNTNCLISVTTPKGLGTYQAKLIHSGQFDKLRIHWTEHPHWIDGLYYCKPGCPFHSKGGAPHSPKYDAECKKLGNNPTSVAQELDIDYARSGGSLFDMDMVNSTLKHLMGLNQSLKFERYAMRWKNQTFIGPINDKNSWFRESRKWDVEGYKSDNSQFRVWFPPQKDHFYVTGGDVCKNKPDGDYSCLYVYDITDGMVVAEWHGRMDPDDLAVEWAMISKWYGRSSGLRKPLMCIEANDQGLTVNKIIDQMGCYVYWEFSENKNRERQTAGLGVMISPHNKMRMLTEYLVPLVNQKDDGSELPKLVCPFIEFWDEARTIITSATKDGEITPDKARVGAQKGCHDDRVMAMNCCVYGAMKYYGRIKGYTPMNSIDSEKTAEEILGDRRHQRIPYIENKGKELTVGSN